jgi:NADPH:quinone reductase-like Zn-dependent oxidoreductase
MLAAVIEGFGGRDRLKLMDVPRPDFGEDEVLIRVEAAGIGLWDVKVREGTVFEDVTFPLVLGWECSGVIEEVGSEVVDFAPGDEVLAYAYGRGTYAEYVACPASVAAHKPASLGFEEAAALPVVGITAHQVVTEDLHLRAGETTLITAASGGAGHLAVQLAARLGSHVIATASPSNHDFLRALGAAEVFDYRGEAFPENVRKAHPGGVDALMECVGGKNFDLSLQAVKRGGRAVGIAGPPPGPAPNGVEVRDIIGRPDGTRLSEVARLVGSGELQVHIQEVLPMEEVARAHELVEAGHVRGKLVLRIAQQDAR